MLSSEAGDHTCPRGSTRELLFDFVAREPDDVASVSADVDFNFMFLSNYFVLNLFFVVKEVDDVASLSSFVDFLLVQFSSQIIYSCMY